MHERYTTKCSPIVIHRVPYMKVGINISPPELKWKIKRIHLAKVIALSMAVIQPGAITFAYTF